jgi:para-aminobenzoate synthetase
MTGAPKLRSVQLLEQFEQHQPRGIYSGAMGYMSIDGAVDLSVVIRTIIIQDGQKAPSRYMTIGAGGAITWLSDPLSEWEEVLTKVRSVVG